MSQAKAVLAKVPFSSALGYVCLSEASATRAEYERAWRFEALSASAVGLFLKCTNCIVLDEIDRLL